MRLPEKQQRPGVATEALGVSLTGDTTTVPEHTDVVRCERCNKPISRPSSIAAGMGDRCRRVVEMLIDTYGGWAA